MARVVYKYPLDNRLGLTLTLPVDRKLVRAAFQGRECLCLWYEVLEPADKPEIETMEIHIHGTGHSIAPGLSWLASVESPCKTFIWHLYTKVITP